MKGFTNLWGELHMGRCIQKWTSKICGRQPKLYGLFKHTIHEYIVPYVTHHKRSISLKMLKSCRNEMNLLYWKSWKHCVLPFITTVVLCQLMQLGTSYSLFQAQFKSRDTRRTRVLSPVSICVCLSVCMYVWYICMYLLVKRRAISTVLYSNSRSQYCTLWQKIRAISESH